MKTLFNHSITQPCEKLFCWFSSLRSSLRGSLSIQNIAQSLKAAPAWLAILAIQTAGRTSYKALIALILIAMGPLAEHAYVVFDATAGDPSLSYWNAYYFFNAIGDDIESLLYVSGFYLMLPEFSKWKFALLIPAGYKFAHICYMPFVTSNEQFHRFGGVGFLFLGVALALWYFIFFEWLMHLHFHKREGIWRRIEGILKAPGIADEQRVAIARKEIEVYNSLK